LSDYSRHFVGRYPSEKGHGRIVADWRLCRDGDFIAALAPASPRLERAKALWARDPGKARAEVIGHFRQRRRPAWAFDFRRKRTKVFPSRNFFFGASVDAEMAGRSLKYEFYDYNLTGNYHKLTPAVDWDRAFVSDLGSAGWLTLSFAYWALFPAAGFAMERDPRYAAVLEKCWGRWFEEYPTLATEEGLAGHGDFNSLDPSAIDIRMNVGRRALVLTDVIHSGLLGALGERTAFELLKYLWFVCGLFLRVFDAHRPEETARKGNHNLFDLGVVPVCLGVMYPEFPESARLVRRGRQVVRWHATDPVSGAIRPDGTSWERSTRYAWYAAGMFRQVIEVARLNGTRLLSAEQEQRVTRFLDHFADMTAPDGILVPYGDCQPPKPGCQLGLASELTLGTACEAAGRRLGVLQPVHAPARRAAKGGSSLPPTSRFFESGGLLVARSGWGRADSMLFVTADPRAKKAGHSHDDFGAFQLWCNGEPLFLDAATWAYRIDRIVPAERGYYYSAFSHNMLTVEGYRPRKVFQSMGNVADWWGDPDHSPVTTEKVELDGPCGEMVLSHRAFPGMKVTRRYAFDLARGWLLVEDCVAASRLDRRIFRQWLHAGFGAEITGKSASARDPRTGTLDAADSLLFSLNAAKAECKWTASRPVKLVAERSPEVERAARVFNLGRPRRAYAECATAATSLRMACRIEWERPR
jgi:hypothetical protein